MERQILSPTGNIIKMLGKNLDYDFPVGTILQTANADQSCLNSDWRAFDGSLIKRSDYPLADEIIGDVKFFNATPTITNQTVNQTTGTLQNGSVGTPSCLGNGNKLALFYSQTSTKFTCLVSTDRGATFTLKDIFNLGSSVQFTYLTIKWLGGNKLLVIFQDTTNAILRFAISTDFGSTWSVSTAIGNQATYIGNSSTVVSFDDTVLDQGVGNIYLSCTYNGSFYMSSFNLATKAIANFSQTLANGDLKVIGGIYFSDSSSNPILYYYYNGTYYFYKYGVSGTTITAYSTTYTVPSTLTTGLNNISLYNCYCRRSTANSTHIIFLLSTGIYSLNSSFVIQAQYIFPEYMDQLINRFITNTMITSELKIVNTATMAISNYGNINAGVNMFNKPYPNYTNRYEITIDLDISINRIYRFNTNAVLGKFTLCTPNTFLNFAKSMSNNSDNIRITLSSVDSKDAYLFSDYYSTHMRYVDINSGTVNTLIIASLNTNYITITKTSYPYANDYTNYLQLPFSAGLICKLR